GIDIAVLGSSEQPLQPAPSAPATDYSTNARRGARAVPDYESVVEAGFRGWGPIGRVGVRTRCHGTCGAVGRKGRDYVQTAMSPLDCRSIPGAISRLVR